MVSDEEFSNMCDRRDVAEEKAEELEGKLDWLQDEVDEQANKLARAHGVIVQQEAEIKALRHQLICLKNENECFARIKQDNVRLYHALEECSALLAGSRRDVERLEAALRRKEAA